MDGRGRPKKVVEDISTNVKAGNPNAQVEPVFIHYLTMFSFFELDSLPTKIDDFLSVHSCFSKISRKCSFFFSFFLLAATIVILKARAPSK